jgi:hypothetical protein
MHVKISSGLSRTIIVEQWRTAAMPFLREEPWQRVIRCLPPDQVLSKTRRSDPAVRGSLRSQVMYHIRHNVTHYWRCYLVRTAGVKKRRAHNKGLGRAGRRRCRGRLYNSGLPAPRDPDCNRLLRDYRRSSTNLNSRSQPELQALEFWDLAIVP